MYVYNQIILIEQSKFFMVKFNTTVHFFVVNMFTTA